MNEMTNEFEKHVDFNTFQKIIFALPDSVQHVRTAKVIMNCGYFYQMKQKLNNNQSNSPSSDGYISFCFCSSASLLMIRAWLHPWQDLAAV